MSVEFSRTRILDRIWARFAQPHTAGLALLALACAEALRHWQSSDEATMLTRVCAVIALCAGVVSTLEMLRPHPRHVAQLSARQMVHARWFPFFKHEFDGRLQSTGWRWRAGVALYALVVIAIAAAALMSSVQSRPSGELMLYPGQDGQEAYHELYPERGLRRALALKLQLRQAGVQENVPYALLRATDMETMAATDVTLRSTQAVRVRDNLYAIKELRPVDGLGGVSLRVQSQNDEQKITLYPGNEQELNDGSILRWEDSSASRFGTLGAALFLVREKDNAVVDRRWVYLDFPALNAQYAASDFAYHIDDVQRPLAVMLSVQKMGGPAWGILGVGLLVLSLLLIVLQRFLPAQTVGRSGDYLVLSQRAGGGIEQTLRVTEQGAEAWITPVTEEDLR